MLDFAQRYRETLLYNIYVMGRNSIRRGNTDTWTMYPRRIAEVKDEIAKEMKIDSTDPRMVAGGRAHVGAGEVPTSCCGSPTGATPAPTCCPPTRATS